MTRFIKSNKLPIILRIVVNITPKGKSSKTKKRIIAAARDISSTAYLLSNIVSIVQHNKPQELTAAASGLIKENLEYLKKSNSTLAASMEGVRSLMTQLAEDTPTLTQSTCIQIVMIIHAASEAFTNFRRPNFSSSTKLNTALNMFGHLLQLSGVGLSAKGFYELSSPVDPVTSLYYNVGAYLALRVGTLFTRLKINSPEAATENAKEKEDVNMSLMSKNTV